MVVRRSADVVRDASSMLAADRVLCIDVGGTAIKAAVLGPETQWVAETAREPTPYPLDPERLVRLVGELSRALGSYERVSLGFPGVVRSGVVLTAPFFVTECGHGSPVSEDLRQAWTGLDLADMLGAEFGCPVLVANDADLHGAGVVSGRGIELVVTLGTGVGTAIFTDGQLGPRLELAHHPLRGGKTYNEHLGADALSDVGPVEWNARVLDALDVLDKLLRPDRILVGGGNTRHLTGPLPHRVAPITEDAGLLGGRRAWDLGWSQEPSSTEPLGT
jgi:polyphosphate glucokinase